MRSQRAGQRVMECITRFVTQKLKLKVKETKSAVARPQERKLLGFSFSTGPEAQIIIALPFLCTPVWQAPVARFLVPIRSVPIWGTSGSLTICPQAWLTVLADIIENTVSALWGAPCPRQGR